MNKHLYLLRRYFYALAIAGFMVPHVSQATPA